jgi:hypothetical protein
MLRAGTSRGASAAVCPNDAEGVTIPLTIAATTANETLQIKRGLTVILALRFLLLAPR